MGKGSICWTYVTIYRRRKMRIEQERNRDNE